VYIELRRRGWSPCYVSTRSGFEVDFLAENRIGERQLIQVCAKLTDPGTRRIELRSLAEAMAELRIPAATVVTLRDEDTLDRIIPAWRWFLQVARGAIANDVRGTALGSDVRALRLRADG